MMKIRVLAVPACWGVHRHLRLAPSHKDLMTTGLEGHVETSECLRVIN